MTKKYIAVIIVVVIILLIFVIVGKGRNRLFETSKTQDLDNLLNQTEQLTQEADKTIDDLDAIDNSEDDADKLNEALTSPPSSASPIPPPPPGGVPPVSQPKTPGAVTTSDLDKLLTDIDKADTDTKSAIDDFGAINESEDTY